MSQYLNRIINLSLINKGETAIVERLLLKDGIKKRLLDLGLIEGTKIECVEKKINGPIAILIRGAVICLRSSDAKNILIHNNI